MEADVATPEEVVTHGSVCLVCGEGTYSQHEDRLALEINRLHSVQAERGAQGMVAAGTSAVDAFNVLKGQGLREDIVIAAMKKVGYEYPFSVEVAETNGVSDVSGGVKA